MNHPSVKPTAEQLEQRLAAIVALCQRYNSSAVNMETHALANKVLKIAEGAK